MITLTSVGQEFLFAFNSVGQTFLSAFDIFPSAKALPNLAQTPSLKAFSHCNSQNLEPGGPTP